MSGAYSTYGVKGEMYTGFRCGNLRELHHLAEPVVDGRIKLKGIFKKWDGGMEWIFMAQDRDRWHDFVDVVMNF
jgi:hypothetical protein